MLIHIAFWLGYSLSIYLLLIACDKAWTDNRWMWFPAYIITSIPLCQF